MNLQISDQRKKLMRIFSLFFVVPGKGFKKPFRVTTKNSENKKLRSFFFDKIL